MKYLFLTTLLVLFFSFVCPNQVSAHLVGQPPFFKINGVYSNLYPVPSTSLNNFNLPQDLAAETYLTGQNLNFEMEVALLPVLPEVVTRTKFFWDFGDDQKAAGLKNNHIYQKKGSYLLTIMAQYGTDQPQLIQSVMLNILPDKNYQLPQAVIKVNGRESKDPLTDIINLKFGEDFKFDGSSFKASSGKIVSYFWDFGDQISSNEISPTHKYNKDLGQVFPLLRIKDENGFISDNFVEIENQTLTIQSVVSNIKNSPEKAKLQPPDKLKLFLFGVGILLGIYSIIFLFKRFR